MEEPEEENLVEEPYYLISKGLMAEGEDEKFHPNGH